MMEKLLQPMAFERFGQVGCDFGYQNAMIPPANLPGLTSHTWMDSVPIDSAWSSLSSL